MRTRDGDKQLWTKHPELDVAALRVEVPKGVDLAPFPFDRVADESWAKKKKVRAGQDVFVACFPVRLEANPAGWPLLRKGSIATHPLTPAAGAKTILVDYAHFEGDSGAPLVAYPDGEPLVVGLVYRAGAAHEHQHVAVRGAEEPLPARPGGGGAEPVRPRRDRQGGSAEG